LGCRRLKLARAPLLGADFEHITNPEGAGYSPKEAEMTWNSLLWVFRRVL